MYLVNVYKHDFITIYMKIYSQAHSLSTPVFILYTSFFPFEYKLRSFFTFIF